MTTSRPCSSGSRSGAGPRSRKRATPPRGAGPGGPLEPRWEPGRQPRQRGGGPVARGRRGAPVILVDANLLVYAHDASAAEHARARAWFERVINEPGRVGI